jgi:hypothetical protein
MDGNTPLDLACGDAHGREGIQELLLELDAFAARIQDREGQLPLHLACQRDPLHPVVKQLVRAYPEALCRRHSGGVTPVLGAFWYDDAWPTNADEGDDDEDGEPQGPEPITAEIGNLLKGWVREHPRSVRAFNRQNLETALACFCRQRYGDDAELCSMLLEQYPVALVMAVAMVFPGSGAASLPVPLEIAARYRRSPVIVRMLADATERMACAALELVLHATFGRDPGRSGATVPTYDPKESLYRRVRALAERTVLEHCPGDELRSHRRGRDGPSAGALALVRRLRHRAADGSGAEFLRGICRSFLKSYDVRAILRDDAEFRAAATALFRMTGSSSCSSSASLPRPVFWQLVALSLSENDGPDGESKHGDLTAIFLRVREDGFHDLILPALVRGRNLFRQGRQPAN